MSKYLKITNRLVPTVLLTVDSYFDAHCQDIDLTDDMYTLIEAIEGSVPYEKLGKANRVFLTRYGGLIPMSELSSGSKSVILILERLRKSDIDWIPSLNSMGPNAKSCILHYLQNLINLGREVNFPLYCTDASILPDDFDFLCYDYKEELCTFVEAVTKG